MRRILVVRAGAIGDGVLTMPALGAIRARWPGAHLTLVGPRTLLPFALAAHLIDVGLPIEGEAGLLLHGEATRPVPSWAECDLAVVWLQRWEAVATRLRSWGAYTVAGSPSLPPEGSPLHVADHLFAALAEFALGPVRLCHPTLVPPPAAAAAQRWWQDHGSETGPAVIALHPGSGGRRKCWPAERFAELERGLRERGYRVLVVLGPAEQRLIEQWHARQAALPERLTAVGLDLPMVAGLLCRCAGYVGNDCGVTHLAAALGLPTLAIFGPTDPARWAPLGPAVRILRDPAWTDRAEEGPGDGWSLEAGAVLEEAVSFFAGGTFTRPR